MRKSLGDKPAQDSKYTQPILKKLDKVQWRSVVLTGKTWLLLVFSENIDKKKSHSSLTMTEVKHA